MAEQKRSARDKELFGYLVIGLALIPISFAGGGIGWLRITLLALAFVLIVVPSILLLRNSRRRAGKN